MLGTCCKPSDRWDLLEPARLDKFIRIINEKKKKQAIGKKTRRTTTRKRETNRRYTDD